ncbi:hypothetical protein BJ944DRAFT_244326 [Cunninghamella echinulata]|nr:hypothetical protein BJ944DRAFT_244326 [Cunninghamella echinulata]
MKRPRAPIACFRCHHKKVRCDGGQPFCTRCQSTGSVCSYPSSRRSRNTQSNLVDPYIDHLSQLEHYIRQIEAEMNDYRTMLTMTLSKNESSTTTTTSSATDIQFSQSQQDYLKKQLYKTEQEVQESRTILAQLRLRGEQRIARMKRNQVKESKQQKGSSTTSSNKTMKNKNKNGKTSPSSIIDHNKIKKKDDENEEENEEKEKVGSSLIKTNDLVNYNDLFLSTSTPINSVNEAATLYPHDNISMYSAPSSTSSIHPLFSLQQQPCTSTATAEQSLYYSSLNMMDYPFTAPTDFNNNDDDNGKSINKLNHSSIITTSPSQHHHNNSMFDHQLEELRIRENEHYSTSTVAAIEEATRLAQLHQFLQTNPSFNMNQQQQQNKYQD